jgi:hypothetical protein
MRRFEISDLYRLALEHGVQIRRLNFKRDSLEDIFLKAMENGNAGEGVSASVNNGNAVEKERKREDEAMAVYEHLYGAYEGESHSAWSRFLVIPRYALRETFKSKLFTTIFILCFIYPLVATILVYLHHNANALALLQINVRELLPIDASFFLTFVQVQCAFAFILTVLVAPPLISRDLSNNALPLYLCRPLSRAEYVLGKMAVVVFLLSLVTWIPGLLIFFFQASLAGLAWLWANLWMIQAIFSGSMVWIILLSLLALAVSSLVKWRVVASGALLGMFFVPTAFR